jgi:hypothetical protein
MVISSILLIASIQLICCLLLPPFFVCGFEVAVAVTVGLLPVFAGLAASALLLALALIDEAMLESVGAAADRFVARQESVVDVVAVVWSMTLSMKVMRVQTMKV